MTAALTLDQLNALPEAEFLRLFGGVLEHSPHYARLVCAGRPYARAEEVAEAFRTATEQDSPEAQLALIRAHPDLAGKAALAGDLSTESASEQTAAGLDRLSPGEYAEFFRLNAAYHARFDLPYVVCVREHDKASILAGAAERLNHSPEQERATALREIGRIARLRVLDLIADPDVSAPPEEDRA
jgi:OHCU decarboxylase